MDTSATKVIDNAIVGYVLELSLAVRHATIFVATSDILCRFQLPSSLESEL
jgi:hypothetical protein